MPNTSISAEFVAEVIAHSCDWVVIARTIGGNTVVQHPNRDIIIKYGRWVTQEEAEAQRSAYALLDPAIIQVPKVYGFFCDSEGQIGYLAMEKVNGVPVNPNNDNHLLAVSRAMRYLPSLKRDFPGPLHSGTPQGILWEDSVPAINNTVEGLEQWINQWQPKPINLRQEEFVLCHLDTALRNMLIAHSGQISLLDWASAGYYPRYFELAAHLKKGRPDEAVEKILQSPDVPFSQQEKDHMDILIHACANSMAYAYPQPKRVALDPSKA